MPTFASPSELGIYTGETIADNDPAALLALQLATDLIQADTFNTIFEITETIKLDGDGKPLLLLPGNPITQINSLTEDDIALTEGIDYFANYKAGYISRYKPSLIIISSYWLDQTGTAIWSARQPANIVVNYTHGYSTIPGPVKLVCLAVADRIKSTYPSGIRQESVGSYSVTFTQPTVSLLDSEKSALDPYRNVQAY